MTIMIVEDDMIIQKELSILLMDHGYETLIAKDFKHILETVRSNHIDLLLLDIHLPFENGYEICKKIKKEVSFPILFVTSHTTDTDELLSIQAGGLDFITKPYHKLILLEKIKRALSLTDPQNKREIGKKGYTLDTHLSILKYQGKEVELTRNEFRILYYFFTTTDRIITKEELLEKLWNDKYYLDENILVVSINRLRKKAQEIGITDLIKTVWKQGYQL